MQTCALADVDDVVDDDPFVTQPVAHRLVAWTSTLPCIPPLHEHIAYAAHVIRKRSERPRCSAARGTLVPGSAAALLWTFIAEYYPAPVEVDGPDLRLAFCALHPDMPLKTYQRALARLIEVGRVISTRLHGARCRYRAVRS